MKGDPVRFIRWAAGIASEAWNRVMLEDGNGNLITNANPLPVSPQADPYLWTVALIVDETTNDSDKIIATVPADELWQSLVIWIEFTTTATVGDRQIVVEVQDDTNDVVGQYRAGAVQAASKVFYYVFAPALADLTAFRDTDYLMTPLPPTELMIEGWQVRVYDNAAVDAAADDLVVRYRYAWRTA